MTGAILTESLQTVDSGMIDARGVYNKTFAELLTTVRTIRQQNV